MTQITQEMKTMKKDRKALIAAIATTALVAAGAARAENGPTPDQQKMTTQQISADKDFGKLSADGSAGFQDLTLARLAIFDGRTDDAKKFVNQADAAFKKAKTDETVFKKAESDLKPPAAKDAAASKSAATAEPEDASKTAAAAKPEDASKTAQMNKPIEWLPVNGSIVIDEDYNAKPAKTAAVAEANKSLKAGDRKGALEKLKLGDLKVVVAMAVLPVEQTISKLDQAVSMINDGKYYEASQELRQVQASERFDVVHDFGTPSN
jgi:hypothetical protein